MANLSMFIVKVPEFELYTDWEERREEKGECIKHGHDMKHWIGQNCTQNVYTRCVNTELTPVWFSTGSNLS